MSRSKTLFTALVTTLASLTFIALGFWQLDRAAQVKELQTPYEEKPIVKLSALAKPNSNLSGTSVNRVVKFSGSYVAVFDAPEQIDSAGNKGTWLVGLMEVDGGGYILVVRSSAKGEADNSEIPNSEIPNSEIPNSEIPNSEIPRGDILVTGRLFHRQYDDVAMRREGILSRLDPSLLVGDYPGDYYDGFVLAQSEVRDGLTLEIPRVALDPAKPTVPGYYWQHIAYVFIWWLMALVVVFLPMYSRFRQREGRSK